jgi:DNA-binding SARP family transcriptional activator
LGVYAGELAAGRAWPWITAHRELLRRRVLDAYTELAATADPHTAVTLLTRALDVDPYNEQLHRQVIAAHTAAGHPDAIAPLITAYTARLAALGEPAAHDPAG